MDNAIGQAAAMLKKSRKAVALTGAGVSTESGIPDFRSVGGLWSRFDPFEYGTLGAFQRDPHKVWQMLKELLLLVDCRPNKGHEAMARLEEMGIVRGIITQNIDGLHQLAGSRHVVEFHGSMASFSCLGCGAKMPLAEVKEMAMPPLCSGCRSVLKPDVVFFDEQIPPKALLDTEELLCGVDLLLVVGTSCEVMPAALIPRQVLGQGGELIEINLVPVLKGRARLSLAGKFTEVMSAIVDQMTES
ncbi:MAG: Sir2 family NAD-dependent protein deacetylase [Proteobacteria bacterium]|nr:Sir2 family NAD-dependent protein deacetylase [Pseudomonadota bacterium]MBU4294268.1 Sir2 family NAD-dependent protein deacetylase [Pseudomonadota bacterium]MCG2747425.1 Sir2 family NAD-dependent protein deacetylase [Desulfobulbaceae bacterium]